MIDPYIHYMQLCILEYACGHDLWWIYVPNKPHSYRSRLSTIEDSTSEGQVQNTKLRTLTIYIAKLRGRLEARRWCPWSWETNLRYIIWLYNYIDRRKTFSSPSNYLSYHKEITCTLAKAKKCTNTILPVICYQPNWWDALWDFWERLTGDSMLPAVCSGA